MGETLLHALFASQSTLKVYIDGINGIYIEDDHEKTRHQSHFKKIESVKKFIEDLAFDSGEENFDFTAPSLNFQTPSGINVQVTNPASSDEHIVAVLSR
jgi:hypothetical protein